MFNLAIFNKTFRDSAWLLLAASLGIIAFVVLFVWAMINMGEEVLEFMSKFAFLRKMMEMAFGINTSGEVSIAILFSVCFAHAMVLLQSWAVIIATSTRITAGEVERGTADLLLSLPVTRTETYLSGSSVWVLAALILGACPIVGVSIGTMIFTFDEPIELVRYVKPAINLMALLIAVGGVSSLSACIFNRRGLAIAVVAGMGIASMILNFLEPFIEPIKHIRFLGLLNFFRPVDIVRTNEWPVSSILALLSVGFVCWLIGLVIFSRKDIPTA